MSRLGRDRLYWTVLIGFVIAGVGLGLFGWWWELTVPEESFAAILGRPDLRTLVSQADWGEIVYRAVLLFFGEGSEYFMDRDVSHSHPLNYPLQVARTAAPLATLGAVIRVVIEIFSSRVDRWWTRRQRHHVVVCGLGERGSNFALSERVGGNTVVAIEAEALKAHEDFCDRNDIRLVRGDCQDAKALRAAAMERATHIIVATGDDNGNLKAAMRTRALVAEGGRRGRPLKVYVSVNNPNLWREITRSTAIERSSPGFELVPFSLSVLAARRFFWDEPLYSYADIRGQRRIHAVFIGFGDYGESLLVQMLQCCAFKDFEQPLATVLAPDAEREAGRLRLHYPEIDAVTKISFREFDPSGQQLDEALMASVESVAGVTAVFVCLGSDDAALAAAIHIYEAMRRHGRWGSPVYVRMRKCEGIEEMLTPPSTARRFPDVIKAFGMDGDLCSVAAIEGALEDVAYDFHEAYLRSRKLAVGDDVAPERRESTPRWEELPETYRQSNRRAADHIKAKLASAGCRFPPGFVRDVPEGFRLSDPDSMFEALAVLEHRAWCIDRRLDGWRPGAPRDNAKKIHDKLVDYAVLKEPDREYDRDQIRLLDEGVLRRRPDVPVNEPLIRKDHWIGLIGRNRIRQEDAVWIREELFANVLPKLAARSPGAHFTLVTPLAPGSDYIMARAASMYFDTHGVPHRVIVAEGVPETFMVDDYREAFEAGAAWDGEPPVAGRSWLDPQPREDGGRARIIAARRDFVLGPETDWVIDLTCPEIDYGKPEARRAGYRQAGDYIAARCHTLIAATDPAAEAKPGGTAETLERRIDMARQASADAWPELWPRSRVILDLIGRTVRHEIDLPSTATLGQP